MTRPVSVILLSDFCSGSTALQSELTKAPEIRRADAIETQYWCKAAALLGMRQHEIMSSILPMASDAAKSKLTSFLLNNLPDYSPPKDDETLIFEGWRQLTAHYAPLFFEKSPHHLHYWSALELIHQAVQRLDNVEFKFIGLIRNPIGTIYSRWRQWRNNPYKAQWLWHSAYKNLLRFKELIGDQLIICRYEDIVTDKNALFKIFDFLGVGHPPAEQISLHPQSIGRWKKDPYFAFQLDPTIIRFAESLGYRTDEMKGRSRSIWPLYWRFTKLKFHIGTWKRQLKELEES